MRLSGLTTGWPGELTPASGWTWWLTHMPFGICYCEAAGKRSGKLW